MRENALAALFLAAMLEPEDGNDANEDYRTALEREQTFSIRDKTKG